MKVIFLDYKGVLDTSIKPDVVNYENLQRLKCIVSSTCSDVVITSESKNEFLLRGIRNSILNDLVNRLMCEGINVLGFTEMLGNKEEEIIKFVVDHPEVEEYVVLDSKDMDRFGERMIRVPSFVTNPNLGLDDINVSDAINVLGVELKSDKKRNY